jgi:uncharacterized protein
MPSHRVLALLRGRAEGVLDIDLDAVTEPGKPHPADGKIMAAVGIADRGRKADKWLADTARLAWKAKLAPSLVSDLLARAKDRADAEAISVFSKNLKDLLLAAPAGPRIVRDRARQHPQEPRHREDHQIRQSQPKTLSHAITAPIAVSHDARQ